MFASSSVHGYGKYWRRLPYLILFLMFCSPLFAYNDGHSYPDKKDKRLTPPGSQYEIRHEAPLIIDRYDESLLRNDPSVLQTLKTTNRKEIVQPKVIIRTIEKPVFISPKEPDITVTTTYESDE